MLAAIRFISHALPLLHGRLLDKGLRLALCLLHLRRGHYRCVPLHFFTGPLPHFTGMLLRLRVRHDMTVLDRRWRDVLPTATITVLSPFHFKRRRAALLEHGRLVRLRNGLHGSGTRHITAFPLQFVAAGRLDTDRRMCLHRGSFLMITLAHRCIARMVTIMFVTQRMLVFTSRITVTRIMTLVCRRRCGVPHDATIPVIPAMAMLRPARTPMDVPTRRRRYHPTVEIRWRIDVVTHRHPQHEQRYVNGINQIPGPVIPGARIPAVVVVDPVKSVEKKQVCMRLWRVVHGITGYRHELGVIRLVNADTCAGNRNRDADFAQGRRRCGHATQ